MVHTNMIVAISKPVSAEAAATGARAAMPLTPPVTGAAATAAIIADVANPKEMQAALPIFLSFEPL